MRGIRDFRPSFSVIIWFLVTIGALLVLVSYYQQVPQEKSILSKEMTGIFSPRQKKYTGGDMIKSVTFFAQKELDSKQFIKRHGMLVLRKTAPAVVLVCHGYSCDKYDIGFVRFFLKKYHCMTFDFRAHGEVREGQCCTFGRDEACDVLAAVEYIKSRPELANLPLIVYGFSMGAVAAIEAQAFALSKGKKLFDAMILDCPYEQSEKVVHRGLEKAKINVFGYEYGIPGKSILKRYAFHEWTQPILKFLLKVMANMDGTITDTRICMVSPEESIKKISVPCFFIYCANDDKISVDASMALFNGANGFKRLWITHGRRHFDSFFYNPEKYWYKINRFIEKFLSGELDKKESARISKDKDLVA